MKSPNKQVKYGKGYICQNCGCCDWRFMKSLDTRQHMFYCVHCAMMFVKIADFSNTQLKKSARGA